MSGSDDPEHVAIDVRPEMGVLDEATCVQRLESTPIGRIGFSTDGGLLVLPVNSACHENSVVFRTLEGQRLAAAAEHQHVCFEVDHRSDSPGCRCPPPTCSAMIGPHDRASPG